MHEIQEIEVVIDADGNVQVAVQGVKGQTCLDITRGLEAVLGGKVVVRTHTDEFYQNEQELDQNTYQSQTGGKF